MSRSLRDKGRSDTDGPTRGEEAERGDSGRPWLWLVSVWAASLSDPKVLSSVSSLKLPFACLVPGIRLLMHWAKLSDHRRYILIWP